MGSDEYFSPPESLVRQIRAADTFVLFSHIYPDGDSVGSQLGLYRGLQALGKTSHIINAHPAPEKYRFLDPEGVIDVVDGSPSPQQVETIRSADLRVILDTSDPDRLGRLEEAVFAAPGPRVVIDHHLSSVDANFDVRWAETTSPATGNLVLNLLAALEVKVTKEIAEPLLVALGTDTGWFRFSNASPAAFIAASELVAAGGDPEGIYARVFETSSVEWTRLLGELLSALSLDSDGRVAHCVLRREMLTQHGVGYEETDGFIDSLKSVQGVEIAFLLVELSPGRYKVSLRSKGLVEIHTIAERFGGGGHAKAAGCRLEGTESEVRQQILGAAIEVLGSS